MGLISRFFHQHVIGDHYAGLLRSFPRNQASYTVFQFPEANDTSPRGIEGTADEAVVLSLRLAEAREQIASRELDVLVYTDIGMESLTYFLAFARLARVQCVTLGHPVTSGIPTIDYFLSSDLLEPADADAHYTERLVRFANSPHYLSAPRIGGTAAQSRQFSIAVRHPVVRMPSDSFQDSSRLRPDHRRDSAARSQRNRRFLHRTAARLDVSLTRTPAGIPFGPHFAGLFSAADAIRGVSRVPASGRRADRFGPFLRRHDDLSRAGTRRAARHLARSLRTRPRNGGSLPADWRLRLHCTESGGLRAPRRHDREGSISPRLDRRHAPRPSRDVVFQQGGAQEMEAFFLDSVPAARLRAA